VIKLWDPLPVKAVKKATINVAVVNLLLQDFRKSLAMQLLAYDQTLPHIVLTLSVPWTTVFDLTRTLA